MNLSAEEKEKLEQIEEYKNEYQWFIKISRLVTGASFGELALINDQPRAATIQCLSDVYVAVLSKNDY
jgi:CRP-like cAMP-binding protein